MFAIAEFAPSSKAECMFDSELVGNWVLYSGFDHEEAAIEGGEVRFSTLGRFTCKSKHWEEDFYKVFSVFTNGWLVLIINNSLASFSACVCFANRASSRSYLSVSFRSSVRRQRAIGIRQQTASSADVIHLRNVTL
jgi:hypothetical protein